MDELLGTMMGRYRLDEKIGEGGMASVYKALDTILERWVAIKVITSKRQASENFLKRFEREAKALAKLSHPGIMDIHDYGEQDGHPFIVMEYLSNGTLKQYMGKPIQYQKAAKLMAPVAEALAYAHKQGIVHRDVKPANILFSQHNKPMIGDFGIVKVEENDGIEALTQVGTGIGTPAYMSPEQGKGSGVDHRTDVYALGVVFYELITGRRPYEAPTPTSFFFKQMTEPLPDPRIYVPGIPQEVVDFVNKALSIHLDQRVQTMDEFAESMNHFATGKLAQPSFQEAPTRMISAAEATMLESKPHIPAIPPPPSQSFSSPPASQSISTPPIYDSSNSIPPLPKALPDRMPTTPPKKKKKTWIIFVVIGALIILGGLCAIGLWILDASLAPEIEPTRTVGSNTDQLPTMEDPTKVPTAESNTETAVEPTNPPAVSSEFHNGGNISTNEFRACLEKSGYINDFDSLDEMIPLVCDNFDDNRYNWYLQSIDTDYITGQTSIVDGTLRMQMTSKDTYAQYWQWIDDILVGEDLKVDDFVVILKIRRIQGPAETLIGVDYRETESGEFYSYSIYENSQTMTLEFFDDSGYTELASANIPGWSPTLWNQLTLFVFDDSHFLMVNAGDASISHNDSQLMATGKLSLWIGAINAGDSIIYEIDDLLIYQLTN